MRTRRRSALHLKESNNWYSSVAKNTTWASGQPQILGVGEVSMSTVKVKESINSRCLMTLDDLIVRTVVTTLQASSWSDDSLVRQSEYTLSGN
jgi:hypothetical protein